MTPERHLNQRPLSGGTQDAVNVDFWVVRDTPVGLAEAQPTCTQRSTRSQRLFEGQFAVGRALINVVATIPPNLREFPAALIAGPGSNFPRWWTMALNRGGAATAWEAN